MISIIKKETVEPICYGYLALIYIGTEHDFA